MRVSFASTLVALASAAALTTTAVPEARAGTCWGNYQWCVDNTESIYQSCVNEATEAYVYCMNSLPAYCYNEGAGNGTCEQQMQQCEWQFEIELDYCEWDRDANYEQCDDELQVCRSRHLSP